MKIAIVLFNLATEAGAPRLLLSFAQALKKSGHEVVVFTAEYDPNCFAPLTKGLDVREIKGTAPVASTLGAKTIFGKGAQRIMRYRLAGQIARNIVRAMDDDFDIVNCHTDFSYRVGALYKKINSRAKFVWTMHDSPFDFNPKKNILENLLSRASYTVEKALERKFFIKADLAVTLDNRNGEIARGFGLRTEIVRGGVDFDSFYGSPKTKMGADIQLVAVGSLGPYRRFEDVVTATALLRRKGFNAKALLVCEDFWSNKTYRHDFEKFIEASGVKEYIDARFKGVPEKEFAGSYRKSDVYVYATNIRIWGMAPFEAMAAGIPAIVCDASSDAEVLADGENALLVPPSRPDRITECVERLAKSPELYESIAVNGQKFVRDNLTWEKYAENFIQAVAKS